MEEIDTKYLSEFERPMMFDESTVRKKLKEYCAAGIIVTEKQGRKAYYCRAENTDISDLNDVLHYFSEAAPCGVIGSFLLDKDEADSQAFTFKHHYITAAIDSGVLAAVFTAMREKRAVTITNTARKKDMPRHNRIIPLRVLISAQNGRQHLFAYLPEYNIFTAYRLDYLSDVKLEEPTPRFDELRAELDTMQSKMWGVSIRQHRWDSEKLEHIEFTIKVEENEEHIVKRLEREKRIGTVEMLKENTYRFSADVYDSSEMIPWIRTFICRIIRLHCSNRFVEMQFKNDLERMYQMYGLQEETIE